MTIRTWTAQATRRVAAMGGTAALVAYAAVQRGRWAGETGLTMLDGAAIAAGIVAGQIAAVAIAAGWRRWRGRGGTGGAEKEYPMRRSPAAADPGSIE